MRCFLTFNSFYFFYQFSRILAKPSDVNRQRPSQYTKTRKFAKFHVSKYIQKYSFLLRSSTIKWDTGTSLSSYGCSVNDKFSIVTHGWGDTQAWVSSTIEKILKHRGGCVIFLNYSSCVNNNNYAATLAHWKSLSAMVTVKLNTMEKEGIIPDNIFMYGFSLGARIVIDAAINFGKQKIGMIDGRD